MPGANRVYIQVDIGSAAAEQTLKNLNAGIKNIGPAAKKTSEEASTGFKSIGIAIDQSSKAVNQLASALAGLAVIRLGSQMLQVGDAINRTRIAFEAMSGSAATANNVMSQLRSIAASRPFAFQDIADGARRLAAFGYSMREIPGDIAAITKAVASIGGGAEQVETLVSALGVMREKGVAQAMQLFRQVAAQGIPVMDILRKRLQQETGQILSDTDIRTLMEKGRLAGEATAQALIEGMREMPDKTAEMMDLPTNRIIKMKDEIGFLAQKIESDLAPAVNTVTEALTKMITAFENASPATKKWIETGAAVAGVAAGGAAVAKAGKTLGVGEAIVGGARVVGDIGIAAYLAKSIPEFAELLFSIKAVSAGFTALAAILSAGVLYTGIKDLIEQFKGPPESRPGYIPPGSKLGINPMQTPEGRAAFIKTLPAPPILQPNEELYRSQIEESKAVLARAYEELYKGVAGEYYRYKQELSRMQDAAKEAKQGVPAEATKNLRLAYEISVQTQLKAIRDKNREEQLAADKQAIQNRIDAVKEATSYEASMQDAVIKDTAQKEAQAQVARLEIIRNGAEQERQLRRDSAQKQFDFDLAKNRQDLEDQLRGGDPAKRFAVTYEYMQKEQRIRDQFRNENSKADIDAARETQNAIAEIVKASAASTSEHLRAARQTAREAEIESAQRQIDLVRLEQEQGDEQTARAKIAAIDKATTFELAAADKLAQMRKQQALDDMNEQYDALMIKAQAFQSAAMDAWSRGDDQAMRQALDARDHMLQEAQALQADYNAADLKATAELTDEKAKIMLQGQKEVNEAWISEQKEVFDKFESGVGQVFDALFQKGKGFWQRIGNMAMDTAKQMLKALVVPGVSAGLMTAMGMPVHMESRGDFGQGAIAQMAGMFNQRPVFSQAPKLDIGDLSKVKLLPGAYPPVPVFVVNPAPVPGAGPAPLPAGILPPIAPPGIPPQGAGGDTPANYSRITGYNTMGGEPIDTSAGAGGGGFGSLPIPGIGAIPNPLGMLPFMMAAPSSTGSTMTAPVGGYDANTAAPASGGSWSFAQAGLPTGGAGGYAGYSNSWMSNMFNTAAYGGGPGPQQGASSPVTPLMSMMMGSGAPGQAPGTPAGGFGMPRLPGMNVLQSIQKAGGFSNWLYGPTQYSTISPGGYGSFGPSFAAGDLGPDYAAGEMSASDLPLSMGNAPYAVAAPSAGISSAAASALGGLAVTGGVLGMQASYNLGQWAQNKNVAAPVRGLASGALGAVSGAVAFGGMAALFPVLAAAGPFGLLAAAGIGATIGLIGAFKETDQQHARDLIKRMYGVDISNFGVLNQVVQIAKQKYGGAIDIAVASPDVQQLVNLYEASQGMGPAGPRPMYSATYMQNSQTGGLQLQPTYSNGQVVANPYAGTTTTQWAAASQLYQNPQTAMYVTLDPATASSLFQGQVVNVLNSNPTVVGNANNASVSAGATRTTQLGGLLEPSTVVS